MTSSRFSLEASIGVTSATSAASFSRSGLTSVMTTCRAPDMASYRAGHDADRPGAGDEHVLADEIEGERGMDGVAERIEDRAKLVVDVIGQRHDVEGGDFHIFGEGAGDIDADAARFRVHVEPPAARGAAVHADDMALAGDALADLQIVHVASRATAISPAYSWPTTIGTGTVRCAHSSQL